MSKMEFDFGEYGKFTCDVEHDKESDQYFATAVASDDAFRTVVGRGKEPKIAALDLFTRLRRESR